MLLESDISFDISVWEHTLKRMIPKDNFKTASGDLRISERIPKIVTDEILPLCRLLQDLWWVKLFSVPTPQSYQRALRPGRPGQSPRPSPKAAPERASRRLARARGARAPARPQAAATGALNWRVGCEAGGLSAVKRRARTRQAGDWGKIGNLRNEMVMPRPGGMVGK